MGPGLVCGLLVKHGGDLQINKFYLDALKVIAASACLTLAGCVFPRAAKVPMDSISLPAAADARADTLIVFLPGAQEVPIDIVKEGFVEQVRARNIDADVIVIDSHIGYFLKRTFDVRIRTDIIEPARAKGYKSIWLAGISLGGFGSLMYSRIFPGEIDGVIAIAPFIASNDVLNEVIDAGGLVRWQPELPLKTDDYQRDLLLWLRGYADPAAKRPTLYIGYGSKDGLAQFQTLIDKVLPPDRLLAAPGGHDWPPWKQMWGDVLDRAPLPRKGIRAAEK
jgi:pimeloyl-ACP methyl ester carboxylesterase